MSRLKARPEWLDAKASGRPAFVDRKAKALRGYVVAQEGYFKSDGRGQFTGESLQRILKLGTAERKGLKSRFTHPDLSSDGLGKFLGRATAFRLDAATDARTGERVQAVRADLHFDPTALEEPPSGGGKPLGLYVMDLAESDPDALSSSLVLRCEYVEMTDDRGQPKKDENGDVVPPVWLPTVLHSSDIVDTGDAVDGLLSAGVDGLALPDAAQRLASDLLRRAFGDSPRSVAEPRALAFLERVLDRHYGQSPRIPELEEYKARLAGMAAGPLAGHTPLARRGAGY